MSDIAPFEPSFVEPALAFAGGVPGASSGALAASTWTTRSPAPEPPLAAVALDVAAHPAARADYPVAPAATAITDVRGGLRGWIARRGFDLVPASVAFAVITSLLWGTFFVPTALAVALVAFHAYWLFRSATTGVFALVGYRRVRAHRRIDWRARYDTEMATAAPDAGILAWDDVRHLIIIPTYLETIEKLRPTLDAIANQRQPDRIYVCLAMEELDPDAAEKAAILCGEYRGRFADIYATLHPGDLPGEVRGKSSNEAWASVVSKQMLIDERGLDIDMFTVTSCDADCIFPPTYYDCLTYMFATNPERYVRFWQSPVFLYNNIWDVPAPLRVPTALGGLNHLSRLTQPFSIVFPQSCYSLSYRLANDVGHWDVDVVPEDWHMFLKCFYATNGEAKVERMFLPVYNDGVRAHSYWRTFRNHYDQARRHAWGCSDIPYALKQSFAHPDIPLRRRGIRLWALWQNHILWSTQWFLVTVPGFLFAGLLFQVPGTDPALHIGGFMPGMPGWFADTSRLVLQPCLATLVLLVVLDAIVRPRRPTTFSRWLLPVQFVQWTLMAPITFIFMAMPALEAQIRLALGKRLEYRVTEKA